MSRAILLATAVLLAIGAAAQPTLQHGDVVVTSSREVDSQNGEPLVVGTLIVFGRDGVLKGELASFSSPPLSDPLVRAGTIYVATRSPGEIQRFDLSGQLLAPFASATNVIFLAPGPAGGLLATNSSCSLYHFAADGSLETFRDGAETQLRSCGGVELGRDGCVVYFSAGRAIARWNACLNGPAELITSEVPAPLATLRLLPDGTFLVAASSDAPILHLDPQGNIIRNYGIRGRGLALDTDGTSFWTNEFGWVSRVNIHSGTVLSRTYHGTTWGLAVVGEPRAGLPAHAAEHVIPTASTTILVLLAIALVVFGMLRLR